MRRSLVFFGVLGLVLGAARAPAAAASYRAEVLADHPVAYYQLDETSGSVAHDASGHGFDGTIGSRVVKGRPGLIGDAGASMEFDGANVSSGRDVVRVPGHPELAASRTVSIEAWVYPYDVGVYGKNDGHITLAAYGRDDNPDNLHCRYALELDAQAHVLHFPAVIEGHYLDDKITGVRSLFSMLTHRLTTSRDVQIVYSREESSGNPVRPRQLYHLVGTYDGDTLRFYVNGKLNNEIHVTGKIAGYTASDGIGIGGEFVDQNPVFHGRIDEVAFYDRALSPERVAAHYRVGIERSPIARTAARRHR